MKDKKPTLMDAAELRRRAENQLKELEKKEEKKKKKINPPSEDEMQRLLHELQVHQIQLEMQNAELADSHNRTEALLEKFTDLYDFSPVGYFTLDEAGCIQEVNLTGAAMLGIERSFLLKRRFSSYVDSIHQADFAEYLKTVFAKTGKQMCELALKNKAGETIWADLQATCSPVPDKETCHPVEENPPRWCRLAISDISALKRAEEAQNRLEALQKANQALENEVHQRREVEKALRQSEGQLNNSLEEAQHLQDQLRHLSHRLIEAQEEERKRMSRELHDEITQSLVNINVKLERLTYKAAQKKGGLREIVDTIQQLVNETVDTVHRFARELRPSILDDLGLIPALRSHIDEFTRRTKIEVHLDAHSGVEKLSQARRIVLYRITQSALNNIIQHAEATEVDIQIKKGPKTVRLEIQDNGVSFDVDKVLKKTENKRLGLIGMRERAEMVGGSFSVTSLPGEGTTVRVNVPTTNTAERGGKP